MADQSDIFPEIAKRVAFDLSEDLPSYNSIYGKINDTAARYGLSQMAVTELYLTGYSFIENDGVLSISKVITHGPRTDESSNT